MRKRMLDPDTWTDEKVSALKDVRSYLLWIGCISTADDYGRLDWSSRQFWGRLFPNRADVKLSDVQRWMNDVVSVELVKTYDVNGHQYGFIPTWDRHQNVRHKSKSTISSARFR